jgi:hypothetical protein
VLPALLAQVQLALLALLVQQGLKEQPDKVQLAQQGLKEQPV